MKKSFTLLSILLITATLYGQVPEGMSYQAVIKDAQSRVLTSKKINIKISILQGSENGYVVYSETQELKTNTNGLVSLTIGEGITNDKFSDIDWSLGSYYIRTEIDPKGGNKYNIRGTSQLLSVPYALYAKESGVLRESVYAKPPGGGGESGSNLPKGSIGDIIYHNGDKWKALDIGTGDQVLTTISGMPAWADNQDITGIATNATAIVTLQTEQTTQNAAIALNTAKTGITTQQASDITANTAKVGYTDGLVSANSDVAANTAKTGITAQQASDITTNNAKIGLTPGTATGQMNYWNGTAWVVVATTVNDGATLQMISGVPTWVGGTPPKQDVTNPTTGKIWMDRNLGATQVATSSTDAASYGDLYQWGRGADGHQIRTSTATAILSSTDVPGHANFILAPGTPYDWRSPQNANLWQGVNGVNNPCPAGYRIPTAAELDAERASWSSQNSAGAFASPLKFPVAGFRDGSGGLLGSVGSDGFYWSSSVDGTISRLLYFISGNANMFSFGRALGFSVRCIKD